ncbi:hypothetical protein V7728_05040 [Bacillus sp. JHAA]|uniref:hypothetical protein n=1 Tax=Bacillus TaxID=1386 RepID=UPI000363A468|nr:MULTISPECIES: hypothetical protein [Bacillus amyloliquefaciens group]MCP1460300.1 hypothetical protein [Bacillus amyloliquefaciens]MEC2165896.1 hypothetical protein [Bacillus velezensis]MED1774024.1 hypothetical protein [Bacillus velezensis]RXK26697.1 hypothetical protein P42_16325 [Bacillus velezensis]
MKKWLLGIGALTLSFSLAACNSDSTSSKGDDSSNKTKSLSLEDQLKKDAKPYDYAQVNSAGIKKGTKIVIEGDVTYADNVDDDGKTVSKNVAFTVSKNSDGSEAYTVSNKSSDKFKLQDTVKIYGTYEGRESGTSMPKVKAVVVEKVDKKKEQAKKDAAIKDKFQKTGEGDIEGLGHVKTIGIGYSDEVGIDGKDTPLKPVKMGDMKLYIESVRVLEITPTEDAKSLYFNDQDKVRSVVMELKAENTSSKDITFHPNQSVIVTNTGEQVETDMGLMGEVGGDFLGKVKKEDQTWWVLKDNSKDIKNIKMIIPAPTDSKTFDELGTEKRIDFNILSFEDAKKKDEK